MDEYLFYEKQYLKQWWIIAIFVCLDALFVYACIVQVGMGVPFGAKPAGDIELIILTVILIALTIFTFSHVLITKIDGQGIHYKFKPYGKKWETLRWDTIDTIEIKKYRPIFDYGGWGRRTGCVTMNGRIGMYVRFNKDSLMIGTQKPEEAASVLEKLGKI
jgi:hypothetical protein